MSTRAVLIGTMMVACAARTSQQAPQQRPVRTTDPYWDPSRPSASAPVARHDLAWTPAPSIQVVTPMPDLIDETRWPLAFSAHPQLEPRFVVEEQLASPGVGWLELCSEGADHRRVPGKEDLIAYLGGWCAVTNLDEEAAIARLAPLLHSKVRGLPDAVKLDLAVILAERGDANHAIHELVSNHADNVATLDTLAATYQHLGKDADARAINDHATDIDERPSEENRCHRMARMVMLATSAHDRQTLLRAFKAHTDPTCVRIARALACSLEDPQACAAYLREQGINAKQVLLYEAFHSWPDTAADSTKWFDVELRALGALPASGADELAVSALENALHSQICTKEQLDKIAIQARLIRAEPAHTVTLDGRLAHLIDMTPEMCAEERP